MTSIGFTGTRDGMTIAQWRTLYHHLLTAFGGAGPHEWHDGDCVGADEQAHGAVEQFNRWRPESQAIRLIGHPMRPDTHRAHMEYDAIWTPESPLTRNRAIVNNSTKMFAAPKEYDELMRGSGTWATMRYAAARVPLIVCWPDGIWEANYVPPSQRK